MKLTLVKKISEAKDTKSFFFVKPKDFKFEAGQYAYLTLGEITKQFTISSSPTEKLVQITTRIRKESKFKQNLNKLEIGSEVEARAPFGSFVFTNHYSLFTSHLFLAGGIGITPFRSMIKYNVDKKLNIPMYLIYSNSDSDFIFKKELDLWQKENSFLKIKYIDSSKVGHLDKLKLVNFLDTWNLRLDTCTFSAVGPNAFVNAMEEILEQLNIPEDNIKFEKFTGY